MSQFPTDANGNITRYNPQTGQYEPLSLSSSDQEATYGPSPSIPFSPSPPVQQATHDFDPNTGLSREAWRDQFMGLGSISPQAADQWLRSHGGNQMSGKGDIWQTPYGDTLDLQIGRGAANANGGNIMPAWTSTAGGNQSNGSSFSGNNNSVMQNGGADFGALLQQLLGQPGLRFANGQQQIMNQGAQPYNQYSQGNQPSQSNYFGGMQTTGQTDGTLLGTRMSSVPGNFNQQPQAQGNSSFGGVTKPEYSWNGKAPSMNKPMSSPMGSPSFFNQQNDTQTSTKPLPDNNMTIG